jgi:hypothetical protein
VEGSLDGMKWTEMDRQTHNQSFQVLDQDPKKPIAASFSVTNPEEYRFIRLTQTRPNCARDQGQDCLALNSVDFFGSTWQ